MRSKGWTRVHKFLHCDDLGAQSDQHAGGDSGFNRSLAVPLLDT